MATTLYVDKSFTAENCGADFGVTKFATINDAIGAASTSEENTIILSEGTYDDVVYLRTQNFSGVSKAIYAENIIEQKGNIVIKAADGAEVVLTGQWFCGERVSGTVAVDQWKAELTFDRIVFDSTALDGAGNTNGNLFIPNIQKLNLNNCTFTGVGYGVNSRGSSPTDVCFTGCTIENSIGVNGDVAFEGCTFQDCVDAEGNILNTASVNIQT